MKKILFVFLLISSIATHAQQVDTNFHVYLLVGQSNMAGRGKLDEISKQTNAQILMLDSTNHWVVAKDPVHFDKPNAVGVGPAISFASTMLQANPKIKIGLIPCAWGGSPIKVWQPNAKYFSNYPYDEAIARAKIAMQTGVLKGILWHQGESDNDSSKSKVYVEKLKVLINRFRTDLQQPNLPFVLGEIGYFNKVNFINPLLPEITKQVPNTALVNAEGLQHKGDQLHFDAPSARILGKRYAEAMQKLQTTTKQPIVVLTFDDAEISHYNIVAPLLKKFGYSASFMVCEMARKPEDSIYYMNWQQIAELHKMGFEIGNHTGHHSNMTKLTRERMQQEIAYIENKCKQYGIPKPISFAYPGNRSDSLSQVVLKEMGYQFARQGGSTLYNAATDKLLDLPSYTMGSSDKLGARTMKALQALQPGQVLLFTIHGVPDIAHPDYTTTEQVFTEYLQYMKEHNFKVIALRDLNKLN